MTYFFLAQQESVPVNSFFDVLLKQLGELGPSTGILAVLVYFLYKHLTDKDKLLLKLTERFLELMTEAKNSMASFTKNQENLNQILIEILKRIDELDTKITRLETWKREEIIARDRGDTQKRVPDL